MIKKYIHYQISIIKTNKLSSIKNSKEDNKKKNMWIRFRKKDKKQMKILKNTKIFQKNKKQKKLKT